MSEPAVVEIWPSETGIVDLPSDWHSLAVAEIDRVRREWAELVASTELAHIQGALDRVFREWSIETGVIENLYDIERGVTRTLIEQGFTADLLEHGATNKDREFVLSLLRDQEDALEGLFAFVKQDRRLSTGYIKELHSAITRSQRDTEAVDPVGNRMTAPLLRGEWKKQPNYPRRNGTVFRYCPPEHTASEMERLVAMHLRHVGVPPDVEAGWLHHRFSQIHPFQDGNGRVARALASLVLIRAGLFPMTITRDEKTVYLESLERADAGDLRSLVLLIARRQEAAFDSVRAFLRQG